MRLRNIANVAYGIPRMRELNPSQKGAVAEAAITTAAVELGFTVLRPLCEGRRYDLVIDLEPELLRVQCKLGRYLWVWSRFTSGRAASRRAGTSARATRRARWTPTSKVITRMRSLIRKRRDGYTLSPTLGL